MKPIKQIIQEEYQSWSKLQRQGMFLVLIIAIGSVAWLSIASTSTTPSFQEDESCDTSFLTPQKCYFMEYETNNTWYANWLTEEKLIKKMNVMAETNKTLEDAYFRIEFTPCGDFE